MSGRLRLGNGTLRRILLRLVALFVVSVAMNFVWEVAQMPLYAGSPSVRDYAAHCFVPSLGDGIILLIIFFAGWLVFRRPDWADRPGLAGYTLMLSCGFVIAVAIELGAVHVLNRWTYAAGMPRLPYLDVGLVPVLQMLVLPPVIFKVTAWWLGRRPPGTKS